MEVEMPIAKKSDGNYDWQVVFDAWWKAKELACDTNINPSDGVAHQPVITEMRIYGGSDVLMCPAYGNNLTLAIEILSFKCLIGDGNDGDNQLMVYWGNLQQHVFDECSKIKDKVKF